MNAIAQTCEAGDPQPIGELDAKVIQIFDLVRHGVDNATAVFLDSDREQARSVIQRDELIDSIHDETEQAVLRELTKSGTVDPVRRTRLLLILRILPELERSGDLAEHIASHAVQGLARWLTPRGRSIVQQMGSLGSGMWGLAMNAYESSDSTVAELLRKRDDEIDDLHVSLTSELASANVTVPVAIEMALVARYFERLGDHAVNITRRIHDYVEAGRP